MIVKIDGTEPNIFPAVEHLDARDAGQNVEVFAGQNVEVFLEAKIEGKQIPVIIRVSYEQAEALVGLLEPFLKD
jgi:hypothetical protein